MSKLSMYFSVYFGCLSFATSKNGMWFFCMNMRLNGAWLWVEVIIHVLGVFGILVLHKSRCIHCKVFHSHIHKNEIGISQVFVCFAYLPSLGYFLDIGLADLWLVQAARHSYHCKIPMHNTNFRHLLFPIQIHYGQSMTICTFIHHVFSCCYCIWCNLKCFEHFKYFF